MQPRYVAWARLQGAFVKVPHLGSEALQSFVAWGARLGLRNEGLGLDFRVLGS